MNEITKSRYIPWKLPTLRGIYDKETGKILISNTKIIDLVSEELGIKTDQQLLRSNCLDLGLTKRDYRPEIES